MTATDPVRSTDPSHLPAGESAAADAASAWHRRSLELAISGDAWSAVETQWAADVATLHLLLWESGLGGDGDPAAQLDTVAGMVQQALSRAGEAPQEAVAALSWARNAVQAAFGSPVDALLAARLAPLDHLAALGQVTTRGVRTPRPAAELGRELVVVAEDCAAVARAMDVAGLANDAEDQRRRAVLATFEAFLVGSVHADDPADRARLVDLKWELAMAEASRPAAPGLLSPTTLADALVASVPDADRRALRAELEVLT